MLKKRRQTYNTKHIFQSSWYLKVEIPVLCVVTCWLILWTVLQYTTFIQVTDFFSPLADNYHNSGFLRTITKPENQKYEVTSTLLCTYFMCHVSVQKVEKDPQFRLEVDKRNRWSMCYHDNKDTFLTTNKGKGPGDFIRFKRSAIKEAERYTLKSLFNNGTCVYIL